MVNFLLSESTALKYLIPVAKETKNPKIILYSSGKYNDPLSYDNIFKTFSILKKNNLPYEIKTIVLQGTCVIVEDGCLQEVLPTNNKLYVITYQTDFTSLYPRYKDRAENIFFPNKKFAEAYSCTSNKNIYTGSPKYDIDLSDIKRTQPSVTIFYPRNRDLDTDLLYSIIDKIPKDYIIYVKSRLKDPIQIDSYRIIKSYDAYYPHTSMILIKRSDFIINFDSTTIKEAFYLRCPVINFKCKKELKLDWFYNPKYPVLQADKDTTFDKMLAFSKHNFDWDMVHKELLFEPGSSKRIADFIMSKE